MKLLRKNTWSILSRILIGLIFIGILCLVLFAKLDTGRPKTKEEMNFSRLKTLQIALSLYSDRHEGLYPLNFTDASFQEALGSRVDFSQFVYTPDASRKSYTLCSKGPVPTDYDQCVTSEGK